jgi:hypothetical protein
MARSIHLQRDAYRLIWHGGHAREVELRQLAAEHAAIPPRRCGAGCIRATRVMPR